MHLLGTGAQTISDPDAAVEGDQGDSPVLEEVNACGSDSSLIRIFKRQGNRFEMKRASFLLLG